MALTHDEFGTLMLLITLGVIAGILYLLVPE